MTNVEAGEMLEDVVARYRNKLPMPTAAGGLEPARTAADVSNPVRSPEEATALALRKVEQTFGDHGPFIPLGSARNRARRHKPPGFPWTQEMKKRALQEFHVNGNYVPIVPEVCADQC